MLPIDSALAAPMLAPWKARSSSGALRLADWNILESDWPMSVLPKRPATSSMLPSTRALKSAGTMVCPAKDRAARWPALA